MSAHSHAVLWAVAVAAMVADAALTVYGVTNGATEGNPVVRAAITALGVGAGVLTVKVLALSLGVAAWRLLPDRHAGAVPAGLAVPTLAAALLNLAVLA